MPMGGRSGYLSYQEGLRSIPFYWEFGGGDVVAIIWVGEHSDWERQYSWAVARKREILGRVAQEVVRQRAPTCKADIDEKGGYIYVREQK